MPQITSVHNPRVKSAVRLRSSRQRRASGLMLIDGIREIARAVQAGVRIADLFVCHDLCRTEEARGAVASASSAAEAVFEVSADVFARLAYGERAEGLLAVAHAPQGTLEDLQLPPRPLVAVLDGVEKPGNVGAVLRSADAAGVSAVVVADGATDLYNPNAIRASLGTIFTLPVAEATSADTLAWLQRHGLAVFAARVDGSVPYDQADYVGPTALVLGSEAAGLGDTWRSAGVTAVALPMFGQADSLNLSATAAVLFYEAQRQRRAGRLRVEG
jgi:TrmH family RNA methyltransferase